MKARNRKLKELVIIQGKGNDSETSVGLYVVKLLSQVLLIGRIPLNDRVVKLIKLVVFGVISRVAFRGSACWPIKVKIVSGRVKTVDDIVDEGPKVARVVKPGIKDLSSVGRQVDDTDLCKKNIEDIEISGLAWVKKAIRCKSCVPVVESDGKIAESLSKTVASALVPTTPYDKT